MEGKALKRENPQNIKKKTWKLQKHLKNTGKQRKNTEKIKKIIKQNGGKN